MVSFLDFKIPYEGIKICVILYSYVCTCVHTCYITYSHTNTQCVHTYTHYE